MVTPKIIGDHRTGKTKLPAERRKDLRVIVPQKNSVRMVESFDTLPVVNKWQEIVTDYNSTFKFLRFGRVVLNVRQPEYLTARRSLAKEEAIYYVNRGSCIIKVNGEGVFQLNKGDVLYVGIESNIAIDSHDFGDVSEFRAIKCHTKYPAQFVRHADIEGSKYAVDLGKKRPMSKRTVYKLIDENVQACRLLFRDTYVAYRGGVGSYPPHFHGPDGPHGLFRNAKEEIYHFRCDTDIDGDIPYVLQNCALPEEKINTYVHVFDEMAVNVTPTYHDTLAPPSVDFMFTWCLGSFQEGHRVWSEMYHKPGYEDEW